MSRLSRFGFALAALLLVAFTGTPALQNAGGNRAASDPLHESEVRGTLLPYFQAMRRGDISRLRPYLSDELYKNYQVLFEHNLEYPRFLRHFYRGASLSLESVSATGDEATARVRVALADGSTQTVVLTLVRSAGSLWQITRIDD